MIEIYDDATLEAALATPLENATRELVNRIVSDARASSLWDNLTALVIIEENDTAEDFEAVLGYPPSPGPLGGEGEAAEPYWVLETGGSSGDPVVLQVPAGNEGFCWFLIMSRRWFDAQIGDR